MTKKPEPALYDQLEYWIDASQNEREQSVNVLLNKLYNEFTVDSWTEAYSICKLLHTASQTKFALIPGGTCTIGCSLDDVYSIFAALKKAEQKRAAEESYPGDIESARPARSIVFVPFLMSVNPVVHATGTESPEFFSRYGWRLPSEAEWEYVAREGGNATWTSVKVKNNSLQPGNRKKINVLSENGFGIASLNNLCWVADDWHANYNGAPGNQIAWKDESATHKVMRMGHVSWQDDLELIGLHPSYRIKSEKNSAAAFYAVLEIKSISANSENVFSTEADQLSKALSSKISADQETALAALQNAWGYNTWKEQDFPDFSVAYELVAKTVKKSEKLLPSYIATLSKMAGLVLYPLLRRSHKNQHYKTYCDTSKLLTSLLAHKDKNVRSHAALLSINCEASDTVITKYLAAIKKEKDNDTLASLLLGIAILNRAEHHKKAILFLEQFSLHKNTLVKTCAALGLYSNGIQNQTITHTLYSGLSVQVKPTFPWFNRQLRQWIMDTLLATNKEKLSVFIHDITAYILPHPHLHKQVIPTLYKALSTDKKLIQETQTVILNFALGKEILTTQLPSLHGFAVDSDTMLDLLTPGSDQQAEELALKLVADKETCFVRQAFKLTGIKEWDKTPNEYLARDHRTLTEIQRKVLLQICQCMPFDTQSNRGRANEVLMSHCRIPTNLPTLRRWLGIDEPGVMERELKLGNDPSMPLYLWISKRVEQYLKYGHKKEDIFADCTKMLPLALTQEELIEASIRIAITEYTYHFHLEELYAKLKSSYPLATVVAVLEKMIMETAAKYEHVKDIDDNYHFLFKEYMSFKMTLKENLQNNIMTIIKTLLDVDRYYAERDKSLKHFFPGIKNK